MSKPDIATLKVDDPVYVWDAPGDDKLKAHFAGIDAVGRILVFYGGCTSWSANDETETPWNYWSPAPTKR